MSKSVSSRVSIQLDQFLDELGFNENDIKERICMMDKCTIAKTLSTRRLQKRDDFSRIFVGSQREGIGLSYLNDIDELQIYNTCICLENSIASYKTTLPEAWLELDSTRTPPGHYFLKAIGPFEKIRLYGDIKDLLIKRFGKTYLSTEKFMTEYDAMVASSDSYLGKHTVFMDRQGPSWPKRNNTIETRILERFFSLNLYQKIDYVRGFPCYCRTILTNWSCRDRGGDWPSKQAIEYVVSLPAFVVPVAQKGTAHSDLQWRLCFTLGEMYLLRTLYNTHMKVYLVLKLLAKHILTPVCPEISSFVMKNVLFWQAEKTQFNDFRPDNLVTCLRNALEHMKLCLHTHNLPYYMMPERNLLLNKISPQQRRVAIKTLNDILNNGVQHFKNYTLNRSYYLTDYAKTIVEDIVYGYMISKATVYKFSVMNAIDLAKFFESINNKRLYISCFLHQIKNLVIPMIYTYGTSVFSVNFNVDIPCKKDILESFRRSQLTNTELSICSNREGLVLPASAPEMTFPGDILKVEERIKCTVRCTELNIHLYWKLHEDSVGENGQNNNTKDKTTIELNDDYYRFDIAGSNEASNKVICSITTLKYKLFFLAILTIFFMINLCLDLFQLCSAGLFADECYSRLIILVQDSILLFIAYWKCRTCKRLDVYVHSSLTKFDPTSCTSSDSDIVEQCVRLARSISPL